MAGLETVKSIRKFERLYQIQDVQKNIERLEEKYLETQKDRMKLWEADKSNVKQFEYLDYLINDIRSDLDKSQTKLLALQSQAPEYLVTPDEANNLNENFADYTEELSHIAKFAIELMIKASRALDVSDEMVKHEHLEEMKAFAETLPETVDAAYSSFSAILRTMINLKKTLVNGEKHPQNADKIDMAHMTFEGTHEIFLAHIRGLREPYEHAQIILNHLKPE